MDEHAVVTAFLRHGTVVLLVRRSDEVGSYAGRWGGVSGYAEGTPNEAVQWEIAEETGLGDAVELVASADPLAVEDDERDTRWLVHPFLFDCESTTVEPNEEIAEYEWVQPPAILERETVPRLWETYEAVAPTVESVRGDSDHGAAFISLRALEVLRDHAAAVVYDAGDAGYDDLVSLARELRAARPSMGVVENRINRVMASSEQTASAVLHRACDACKRAVEADDGAATRAAEMLGERVLTLSRSGTVFGALVEAEPTAVFVAESRPAREGVDVAEELSDSGLDVSLLVDAAIGHTVVEENIDTVVVGADTVLRDGTVVNKVGTRLAALAATEADVDCYAVCARDKITPDAAFDLESGPPETVYDGDRPLDVLNPTFEATPATAFTGIVTEDGVLSVDEVEAIADEHAALTRWDSSD